MIMNLQIFAIMVISLVNHQVFSLNFKNNECSKIVDYHIAPFSSQCRHNPDVLSSVTRMARNNGYLIETHILTTRSGYILNTYRIGSKNQDATGYPILIVHGIAIETGSWTNIGNRSLAFYLVEEGYDVWLASLRGTADGDKHTTWNINNPDYWKFSIDEVAKEEEDLDTQITYIYQITNQKVLLIGHSMGTTLNFMYASEYSEKASQVLRGIVALAPIVYLTGTPGSEFIKIAGGLFTHILNALHQGGILYQAKFVHTLIVDLCKILPEVCYFLVTHASGQTDHFLPDDLLLFLSYWPSGISVRQLKHYLQINRSNVFQKYDFGTASENQKHYNASKPPAYDLSKVQVPVCMYSGGHDLLYAQKNMDRVYKELGTDRKFLTTLPTFSHIDFVNSGQIIEDLYVPLLEKLNTFFN